jgi:hypothetical protein
MIMIFVCFKKETMSIKRLFTLLSGFSLILFITSCAVTYPNEKLIVGDWKPVTAEKYVPPPRPSKSQATPGDTVKAAKKAARQASDAIAPDPKDENQLKRMIQTELRSPISVYASKDVVKFYPGKNVKGTWKMKKKGTRIVAKELHGDKKLTMDILEITDNSATVVERLPFGDIKIVYSRK